MPRPTRRSARRPRRSRRRSRRARRRRTPAEEPPAEEPPAEEPPAEEPPAEEPPAEETPAEETPVEEPVTTEEPATTEEPVDPAAEEPPATHPIARSFAAPRRCSRSSSRRPRPGARARAQPRPTSPRSPSAGRRPQRREPRSLPARRCDLRLLSERPTAPPAPRSSTPVRPRDDGRCSATSPPATRVARTTTATGPGSDPAPRLAHGSTRSAFGAFGGASVGPVPFRLTAHQQHQHQFPQTATGHQTSSGQWMNARRDPSPRGSAASTSASSSTSPRPSYGGAGGSATCVLAATASSTRSRYGVQGRASHVRHRKPAPGEYNAPMGSPRSPTRRPPPGAQPRRRTHDEASTHAVHELGRGPAGATGRCSEAGSSSCWSSPTATRPGTDRPRRAAAATRVHRTRAAIASTNYLKARGTASSTSASGEATATAALNLAAVSGPPPNSDYFQVTNTPPSTRSSKTSPTRTAPARSASRAGAARQRRSRHANRGLVDAGRPQVPIVKVDGSADRTHRREPAHRSDRCRDLQGRPHNPAETRRSPFRRPSRTASSSRPSRRCVRAVLHDGCPDTLLPVTNIVSDTNPGSRSPR